MNYDIIYDQTKWIYEFNEDEKDNYRYALGERGCNPLLVFGINPSTAHPGELDRTMYAVRSLVNSSEKYNGYIMLNIYPQRSTNPDGMHKKPMDEVTVHNLEVMKSILDGFDINREIDIWAAWGSNIKKRKYLKNCLQDIINLTDIYNVRWLRKGKTIHPHHPLYLDTKPVFDLLDIKDYISTL